MPSPCSREKAMEMEKLGRQYRATTITDCLENCKSALEKIGKEIGMPHLDQKLLGLIGNLTEVLRLLVDANRRSDDRAVDCEDRLEKLEQRIQEWTKYYPLPDGK